MKSDAGARSPQILGIQLILDRNIGSQLPCLTRNMEGLLPVQVPPLLIEEALIPLARVHVGDPCALRDMSYHVVVTVGPWEGPYGPAKPDCYASDGVHAVDPRERTRGLEPPTPALATPYSTH